MSEELVGPFPELEEVTITEATTSLDDPVYLAAIKDILKLRGDRF